MANGQLIGNEVLEKKFDDVAYTNKLLSKISDFSSEIKLFSSEATEFSEMFTLSVSLIVNRQADPTYLLSMASNLSMMIDYISSKLKDLSSELKAQSCE